MNAKELVAQELTGKALVIANYQRQIDFIEKQIKILNSPLNESGNTSYTYFGDLIAYVFDYFESKGIKVLGFEDSETRRQNKGNAMYVFFPDADLCTLDEKELAEAKNVKYEKMTPYEEMEYVSAYAAAWRGEDICDAESDSEETVAEEVTSSDEVSEDANTTVTEGCTAKTDEDAVDEAIDEVAEAVAGIFCGVLEAVNEVFGGSSETTDGDENSSDVSGAKEETPGDDGYDDETAETVEDNVADA